MPLDGAAPPAAAGGLLDEEAVPGADGEDGVGAPADTGLPPPASSEPIALARLSIVRSFAVTSGFGRPAAMPPIAEARRSSVCGSVTVALVTDVPFALAARLAMAAATLRLPYNRSFAATWLGRPGTTTVGCARPTIPVVGSDSGRLFKASQPRTAEPLKASVASTAAPTRGNTVATGQRRTDGAATARDGSTASVAVLNDWNAASVRQQIVQACICCCT